MNEMVVLSDQLYRVKSSKNGDVSHVFSHEFIEHFLPSFSCIKP